MNVISQQKTLRHLSIEGCLLFDANDLIISNLTNLESLNVSWIVLQDHDKDRILRSVIIHLQHLKSLGIGLSLPAGYNTLLSLTNFENLEVLDVAGIFDIDDYIMSKFKNFKKFTCYAIRAITDDIIKSFIGNNPNIEYLDVMHTSVTSATLRFLYDLTKARKPHAVLYLVINPELLKETQDYLQLNGDNPYLIIDTSLFRKPIIQPEYKHPHFRKRSKSMLVFKSKEENNIDFFELQDQSSIID